MKGNVHLVNLKYDHCVVFRQRTHIHSVANKIDGYLQLSTTTTAKAILFLLEYKKCHIQYVGKAEKNLTLRLNNHRKDV